MNNNPLRHPLGVVTLSNLAMPKDTNPNGDIFGGWLVSQMDLAASIAAKQLSKGRVVTVAIDKMVFKQPVHVGDLIRCYTEITHIGRTSIEINVEVWSIPNAHEEQHLVTEGVFTFVAIDNGGRPRPLNLSDD